MSVETFPKHLYLAESDTLGKCGVCGFPVFRTQHYMETPREIYHLDCITDR